ncbi:probable tRNA pseudouridine synthase 1 isoform X4 [Melanotaenia boesemani]|uniref:probable tRNA pseudouridine synthase 1 isoform X4 n=1 Tax=Melanotaenia boesemani TaxID=1250792 RepID=UPI001C03B703|nr:probable tRNA pseudouridine synthase 1 isoform X4 [Melanotaenia boesemani]
MAGKMSTSVVPATSSLSKLQSLHGLFAIYKKQGPTSADVLNELKEALLKEAGVQKSNPRKRKKQVLKMGHGGTLDSAASGVLEHITRGDMEDKLKSFTGDIMQVPPLYSALKTQGQRLSVLLKQGHTVEAKPARPVTVYSLTLQDFKPPLFTLDIECGGGFYVRSLVDDLGKALLSCAHVKELIRTKQGPFILQEHVLHQHQWTLEHVLRSLHPCSDRGPPDHQRPTPEEHRDPEREGGAGLTG